MSRRLILFTDLDGTLLELETYDYRPAREALSRLNAQGIPLVFCSSKTRAEQEFYQREMGIRAPMIVENGSAILIPDDYFSREFDYSRAAGGYKVIELGAGVEEIRQETYAARAELQLQFRGYGELSLAELGAWTGLDGEAAARAQARQYSETIVGELSAEDALRLGHALRTKGLVCARGSRFITVMSAASDKGKAVGRLSDLYRREVGGIITAGFGDGANDAPMLAVVDLPFLLQKPGGDWENISDPRIKKAMAIGPAGWNRLVCRLVEDERLRDHSET